MDKGYILLSRSLLDSDVFASQKLLKIWVWCLCKANFKDRSVPLKVGRGETVVRVKRGSFLFGRHKAEDELFIDGSTIYKSMKKLEEMDMITMESNNQYSVVTICKYNDYQDNSTYKVAPIEQPLDTKETPKSQPSNTTKALPNVNTLKTLVSAEQVLEVFKKARKKKGLEFNVNRLTYTELANLNFLSDYTLEDFELAISNALDDKWVIDSKQGFPKHILNPENFTKYLNTEVKKALTLGQIMNGAE